LTPQPAKAIPQWVEPLRRHCHDGDLPRVEKLWRGLIEDRFGFESAPENFGICFANWLLFEIAKEFWETRTESDPAKHVLQDFRAIYHLKQFEPNDPNDPNHLLGLPDEELIRYFALIYAVKKSTTNTEELLGKHHLNDALLVSHRRNCAQEYKTSLLPFKGRKIFSTENGLFGQGRPSMRAEDTVWIIPMILRKAEEDGMYTVIGDAFVYDNMNGEALRHENLSLEEMGGDRFAVSSEIEQHKQVKTDS
jgi:hypothetical protein